MLVAKPIVSERFWIVESPEGAKVGTIQSNEDGTIAFIDGHKHEYDTFDDACDSLDLEIGKLDEPKKTEKTEWKSNGYPTNTEPFNEIFNAKMQLPLYTKTKSSKSYYAAGYYIIRFEFAWAQAFCPKLVTLKRNEYAGPFQNKLEMQEQLRKYNAKD